MIVWLFFEKRPSFSFLDSFSLITSHYAMSVDFLVILTSYIAVFLFGTCLGSFATAISYRVPQGKSWISSSSEDNEEQKNLGPFTRSKCPECGHLLSFLDLVPLFSWFFLKGRCRYCKAKISIQYPLTEFFCAMLS